MVEFLIFGAPKCSFCTYSKILLEDEEINHVYIDLNTFYGEWKNVIDDDEITPYINDQRKIPIIFKRDDENGDFVLPSKFKLKSKQPELDIPETARWRFLGGFNELDTDVKSRDITLDDDY